MKLKTVEKDGKTYAEVQDGKPLYVGDDGKEIAFDAPHTAATIQRLNGEAKAHRTAKEAAETKLQAFEGIEDPEAAKKALSTIKNLDDKKLVDAGQVETVRQEAIAAVEAKYKPVVEERDRLKGDLYSEKIGGSFARSKFISDKIAIPSDLVQARFGQNFEVKDGKIVAKDANGNPIYSRSKPGEVADFDEALETLVDQYPQKDSILKGANQSGGGSRPSNGGGADGAKSMTREAFNKLDPAAQMKAMNVDKVQVVDAA
jgi:hypothetical protein